MDCIIYNHHEKRRDRHPGKINEFLDDSERESMKLPLYGREITRLQRQFPQITITKGDQVNNSKLWYCTITKK